MNSVPAIFHLILILLQKAKRLRLTLCNQALKEQAEERGAKRSVKQLLWQASLLQCLSAPMTSPAANTVSKGLKLGLSVSVTFFWM